jgi:hypothetical protein
MKAVFTIVFSGDSHSPHAHKAMNCVEDIDRALQFKSLGRIDRVNAYNDGKFHVLAMSTRWKGDIKAIVTDVLRRSALEANAQILNASSDTLTNDGSRPAPG